MECPKCGGEMKTCCQLYAEFMEKYEDKDPALFQVGHSCGPAEWICQQCGHRQYVRGLLEQSIGEFVFVGRKEGGL